MAFDLSAWDSTDAYIFASAQKYPRTMVFHDDMFPAEPVLLYVFGQFLASFSQPHYKLPPRPPCFRLLLITDGKPTRSDVDSQQRLNIGLAFCPLGSSDSLKIP